MPRVYDIAKSFNKTPVYQIQASMKWNANHKDKMNVATKKYYDGHKAEISEKKKEYYRRKIEARDARLAKVAEGVVEPLGSAPLNK